MTHLHDGAELDIFGKDARSQSHLNNEDQMRAHDVGQTEAVFQDKVMLVEIYKSHVGEMSIYDAARYAWRANLRRAKKVDYVLAVKNREIVGVFAPTEWLPATPPNFPEHPDTTPGRIDFRGGEAPAEIQTRYLGRSAPAKKRGDQREFHYYGGG